MPFITFEKEGEVIRCNAGNNLQQLAKQHGIQLYQGVYKFANCRGHGLCGSCEVEIVKADQLHPRSRMEEIKLGNKPLQRRLACQITIHGDMTVRTQPVKWISNPPATE